MARKYNNHDLYNNFDDSNFDLSYDDHQGHKRDFDDDRHFAKKRDQYIKNKRRQKESERW